MVENMKNKEIQSKDMEKILSFESFKSKSILNPIELADYNGVIDSCTNLKSLLELSGKGYKIKTKKRSDKKCQKE